MEIILKLKVTDPNGIEHNVEYLFDRFKQTGNPWIGFKIDNETSYTRLSVNMDNLPINWTRIYFFYPSYWITIPLFAKRILKMTEEIKWENIKCHKEKNEAWKLCNCVLVEVDYNILNLLQEDKL